MRLLKNPNTHSYETLQRRLLKVVEQNQEWLVENPAACQWLLANWYNMFQAGRICYGYDGIIKKGYNCENNPKYEIQDMITYVNSVAEDVIYDAWANTLYCIVGENGNHEYQLGTWTKEDFDKARASYLVKKEESYVQLQEKANKTFDEWVEVLTHEKSRYRRLFPDRRSVADHILSVIGNGYGWNSQGFACEDSPSDKDKSIYVGWQLHDISSFPAKYQPIIEQILYCDKVAGALAKANEYMGGLRKEKEKEDMKRDLGFLLHDFNVENPDATDEGKKNFIREMMDLGFEEIKKRSRTSMENLSSLVAKMKGISVEEEEFTYYPFSNDYSLLLTMPKNVHQSYIDAGYEMVIHVLSNKHLYRKEQYTAAEKWLRKYQPRITPAADDTFYQEYQEKLKTPMPVPVLQQYKALEDVTLHYMTKHDVKVKKGDIIDVDSESDTSVTNSGFYIDTASLQANINAFELVLKKVKSK
jgi:hypothetical protein